MPEMGLRCIRAAKERAAAQAHSTPVILLAGDARVRAAGKTSGADEALATPPSYHELQAAVIRHAVASRVGEIGKMPIYEYECEKCKKVFEYTQGIKEPKKDDLRGMRRRARAADLAVGVRAQGRRLVQGPVLVVKKPDGRRARPRAESKSETKSDEERSQVAEEPRRKTTMGAEIIDGKAIAARVRAEVKAEADALAAKGVKPGLAVVLVGEDPASQVYVRNKTKAAAEAGIATFDHKLAADTSEEALLGLVRELNADPRVDGILVQFPVPKQIAQKRVIDTISADKDVDGLHPANLGRAVGGRRRASWPARRRRACASWPRRRRRSRAPRRW